VDVPFVGKFEEDIETQRELLMIAIVGKFRL
jgi:hypothetical protein